MQRAEKNLDEFLENLKWGFHQVCRHSIDEELFDVISGFETLAKKRNIPEQGVSRMPIEP